MVREEIQLYQRKGAGRKLIARELVLFIFFIIVFGILWFGGNYVIARTYRPKIKEVKKEMLKLKEERRDLFAELHEKKVTLFLKAFAGRYDPRYEDTETLEQLMRIYNRYAADDTKFLTYLFMRNIPEFTYHMYKEEIDAFEQDMSERVAELTDRILAPYRTDYARLSAIQDQNFENLYFMYWVHNILLLIVFCLAYPLRYLFKIVIRLKGGKQAGNIQNF